jgi:hypothetical protein
VTGPRRWGLLALAGSSIGVAAWALPGDRPTAAELARCSALDSPAIEVRSSSRLRADGRLEGGLPVSCGESARAACALLAAHDALALVPDRLRPARVTVHLEPALPPGSAPLGALEYHADSASLFARRADLAQIESSVWLHELGHLRARGARPRGRIERRIYAVIEEGAADYYAATIGGSARLRSPDGARDLDRPAGVPPEYWVTLLAPAFDPHPLGWELAAALWKIEKAPGPLLHDLIEGLSARVEPADLPEGTAATPAAVARSFAERCPARSRQAIAGALGSAFGVPLEPEGHE